MAKLIDVAEKAGVSITTASMALSGKGRISDEVRRKVNDAADQLGYKGSRQNRTRHWVILENIDSDSDQLAHFFNPLIRRIREAAEKEGFILSILPASEKGSDDSLYNSLTAVNADCLLSIHIVRSALFDKLEKQGIPCVVINNTSYLESYFTVCVDDFHGAYEGTLELIKAGHRKIAYLDYEREKMQGIVMDRYLGFTKAMQEKGLDLPGKWKKTVKLENYSELETFLDQMLKKEKDKPTAFFLHDDLLAGKVQHILRKKGIAVPGDISLIAPGDTRDYRSPETEALSTMRIDTDLMGQYALSMMNERLSKGEQTAHVLKIRPVYTDRGSIGPN